MTIIEYRVIGEDEDGNPWVDKYDSRVQAVDGYFETIEVGARDIIEVTIINHEVVSEKSI